MSKKIEKFEDVEVRNQLHLITKIGYIEDSLFDNLYNRITELSQQIANFIKYLKKFEKVKK